MLHQEVIEQGQRCPMGRRETAMNQQGIRRGEGERTGSEPVVKPQSTCGQARAEHNGPQREYNGMSSNDSGSARGGYFAGGLAAQAQAGMEDTADVYCCAFSSNCAGG